MRIITNNQPRQLIYGYELTDKERQDFDYLDDIDNHNFVKYRGNIYDVNEFMRVNSDDSLKGWDGYIGESYFSGVLIKVIDSDTAIMARYYS
ncbi:hypothetical protein [Edwardsiella phage vB_EtaM_ET-ABTNL-9]|nr:hypothetical protein [Edwardsiella phage vB_EtaM_ET-ABTNL-9]